MAEKIPDPGDEPRVISIKIPREDPLRAQRSWEKEREPRWEIDKQIIRDVFDAHVERGSRILEIGSGLGRLVRALDDRKADIQQTEHPQCVAAMRENERCNGMKVIAADACKLPFDDGSFDVVTANNVFDIIPEPEKALREAKRVLKEGGLFIHLQDMMPSLTAIYEAYRDSQYVLLPTVNEQGIFVGVKLCPKGPFLNTSKILFPQFSGYFDHFAENPLDCFMHLMKSANGGDPGAAMLLQYLALELPRFIPGMGTVTYQDFFFDTMERAIRGCAMQPLIFQKIKGKSDVHPRRSDIPSWNTMGPFNTVHNDAGVTRFRYDPRFKPQESHGIIQVESSIHVIIAKKVVRKFDLPNIMCAVRKIVPL